MLTIDKAGLERTAGSDLGAVKRTRRVPRVVPGLSAMATEAKIHPSASQQSVECGVKRRDESV